LTGDWEDQELAWRPNSFKLIKETGQRKEGDRGGGKNWRGGTVMVIVLVAELLAGTE
jgi:hypothetical protein